MRSALTPFRVRSYRFQWPADLLTSCAFEMEVIILGWYVLVETQSVLMLTVFGALLYLGTMLAPLVVNRMTDHSFRQWTRKLIFLVSAVYLMRAGWLYWGQWAGA